MSADGHFGISVGTRNLNVRPTVSVSI